MREDEIYKRFELVIDALQEVPTEAVIGMICTLIDIIGRENAPEVADEIAQSVREMHKVEGPIKEVE